MPTKHAFQAVQMLGGLEQILDTFTVTKARSADEAYQAAEALCAKARALPFKPAAFVREIEPTAAAPKQHAIIVTLDGGVVQDIQDIPPGVIVEVRDYDCEGTDDAVTKDVDGRPMVIARYGEA